MCAVEKKSSTTINYSTCMLAFLYAFFIRNIGAIEASCFLDLYPSRQIKMFIRMLEINGTTFTGKGICSNNKGNIHTYM